MNERIRELATRAGLSFVKPTGMISATSRKLQEEQYQMFAELIVRECAGQCLSDDYMRILNHFGVEE